MPKTVRYYITGLGEFRRVMPSGAVTYSTSMRDMMADAVRFEREGYVVLLDDEPLFAETGLLGWLHRLIERLPRRRRPPRGGQGGGP